MPERGREGVSLVQNTEVMRNVDIAPSEKERIQSAIIPAVCREGNKGNANDDRKVVEKLFKTGPIRCSFVREG
jgi:hypothetical protein